MSLSYFRPNVASNVIWADQYEALSVDELDVVENRNTYLKNSSAGILTWAVPNGPNGILELNNLGLIGEERMPATYLRLSGNSPLNKMTGPIFNPDFSVTCLGLISTLLSSNGGSGVAINTANSINFVDASAVNKRLTLADRVDTAVLASQNGTTALTIPATGAVEVSDARGLQCATVSHPTSVSLTRGSAFMKVQNAGFFIEIQGTNSGPMYVNSGNYSGTTNGN